LNIKRKKDVEKSEPAHSRVTLCVGFLLSFEGRAAVGNGQGKSQDRELPLTLRVRPGREAQEKSLGRGLGRSARHDVKRRTGKQNW
jgi:hypothetical protein